MTNSSKIVIALCEGPHDTAFLYRVLRNKCYKNFNKSIENLPFVVKRFIKNGYSKIEKLESLKLNSLKNYNIPNKILYKEDKLVLLYAMGGDTDNISQSRRLSLINDYLSTLKTPSDDKELNINSIDSFSMEENEYSFLFFYDADDDASKQIQKINNYLVELGIKETIEHNKFINLENHKYGCFIFSEDGSTGTLENIMFKLIDTDENKILLDKAKEYYKVHLDERYKKKISIKFNEESNSCEEYLKKKNSPKLYCKKSVLGIMGQLQNSGASNVVTIEHSDYIKLENFSQNIQSIESFFETA